MSESKYVVGSEMVNFTDGTSGVRWYVAERATGRYVMCGIVDEHDARDRAVIRELSESMIDVALAGGGTVEVPLHSIDRFRGLDAFGCKVYESDGLLVAVTRCCEATGTGSAGSSTGVACRSCYEDVDAYFGGSARVTVPRA